MARSVRVVLLTWLSKVLSAAVVVSAEKSLPRARAIFAAVAGAQLIARSRSDISLYDALIDSCRAAGLLPMGPKTHPEKQASRSQRRRPPRN